MKKITSIILLVLLLLSGCKKENEYKQPVNLYYLHSDYAIGNSNALFSIVQVESAGISFKTILDLYLKGPVGETALSPFPVGTKVIRSEKVEDTLLIVMSQNYASLKDLDLTLANACLYRTCSELTGTNRVRILIDGISAEDYAGILLTPENIIFFDQQASLNTN